MRSKSIFLVFSICSVVLFATVSMAEGIKDVDIEGLGGFNSYKRILGTGTFLNISSGENQSYLFLTGSYMDKKESLKYGSIDKVYTAALWAEQEEDNTAAAAAPGAQQTTTTSDTNDFQYGIGYQHDHKFYFSRKARNPYFWTLGGSVTTGHPAVALASLLLSPDIGDSGSSTLGGIFSGLTTTLTGIADMGTGLISGGCEDETCTYAYIKGGIGTGRVINISSWNRAAEIVDVLQKLGSVKKTQVDRQTMLAITAACDEHYDNVSAAVRQINKVLTEAGLLEKPELGVDAAFAVSQIYDRSLRTLPSGWDVTLKVSQGLTDEDTSTLYGLSVVYNKPINIRSLWNFNVTYLGMDLDVEDDDPLTTDDDSEDGWIALATVSYIRKLHRHLSLNVTDTYIDYEDSEDAINVFSTMFNYAF